MALLKETWEAWGAEVIFITSNMQGNDEMMQGCRVGEFYIPFPACVKLLMRVSGTARIWDAVGLLSGRRGWARCGGSVEFAVCEGSCVRVEVLHGIYRLSLPFSCTNAHKCNQPGPSLPQ